MEWNNVKLQLPPDGRYLCIVKYFEKSGGPTLSITTPKCLITECYFDPHRGWEIPHISGDVKVLFWIPTLKMPDGMD